MEIVKMNICRLPAILWGSVSKNLFLYIHGQSGCKEEAEFLANIACQYSWQVLSIDLPEHGERLDEKNSFDPWHIKPELCSVMEYVKSKWQQVALCANSIGAWFSMLSFQHDQLSKCLFISPVLDMVHLISNMMIWSNITEKQLKHQLTIPTSFGQTLSWEYLLFAQKNPIANWNVPTQILYGGKDNLIELSVVEEFSNKFHCIVTIMKDGEHWFHTPEQLNVLSQWLDTNFQNWKS